MSRVLKTGDNVITFSYAEHCKKVDAGKGWARGVDVVKAPMNFDYIVAHSSGTVLKVVDYIKDHEPDKEGNGYGNYVAIVHDNNYVTVYAHMTNVSKLTVGNKIAKGTVLGYMWNTGNVVLVNNNPGSGGHLHFEVRKYKVTPTATNFQDLNCFEWLNPEPYLDADLPNATFKPVKDGVDYSLVFNANFYLNKYADLRKAFGNSEEQAFNHFLTFGMKEHRQAISNFIVDIYKDNYVDLRNAFGEDITKYYIHYIQFGNKEGRNATTPIKKELTPTSYPNYPANSGKSYKVMKKPSGWGDSLGCFANFSTPTKGGAYYVWLNAKNKGYHLYDNDWKQLD